MRRLIERGAGGKHRYDNDSDVNSVDAKII